MSIYCHLVDSAVGIVSIDIFIFKNPQCCDFLIFFFNDTPTTEIYPLSLPDALPIPGAAPRRRRRDAARARPSRGGWRSSRAAPDRKSTRLNSSHTVISYAVFCLKKKKS